MSFDPFENLPKEFREMLMQMMQRLQNLDPEELNEMMGKVFGDDVLEKLKDFLEGGSNMEMFSDPNMLKSFETMMKDFMTDPQSQKINFDKIEEIEPYYELNQIDENNGLIVIDLPGITDLRQINWKETDKGLSIKAEIETTIYQAEIIFEKNLIIQNPLASIKNGVFSLPYKLKN